MRALPSHGTVIINHVGVIRCKDRLSQPFGEFFTLNRLPSQGFGMREILHAVNVYLYQSALDCLNKEAI